ncbi:MAG: hypothetical protein GC182_14140 [Rhodopseudomonas sp.]|nr:hypothetical protein [Rhodopseudomonas sp.]
MRIKIARALVMIGCGLWLAGCSSVDSLSDMFDSKRGQETGAAATLPPSDVTGSISDRRASSSATDAALIGSDPHDDVNEGKKQYRAQNYGLAERYFRRAAELHPQDAEAWLGLAAAYDRLHRFDLADRAYAQAIGILGPTPEILNNQGFSYMLRGDNVRARKTLLAAQRKDPRNVYVANNLRLLDDSIAKGRAVR